MKLVRYGDEGSERPGLIDRHGALRDLSGLVEEIDERVFSPAGQARLARLDTARLAHVGGHPRLGVPFVGISKYVAIGLNYRDHAAETGMPVPPEPIVFMKATTCITGPNDGIVTPRLSTKRDWEVELGIVMGSMARDVDEKQALDHVAGYVLLNDVSERQFQLERGSQWDKGKGCDTFGPIGPWLVTRDEVADPQALDLWLDVNGEAMQRGSTRTMVFGCAELVSYCSRFMTLRPGDVIATGTPPGVGMGRKPQRFLKSGDVVSLGITGLGEQRQTVFAPRSR
jgi:2,4-didehydro-3-deoxy-L-rhamnonate hydrolase